jgi:hypothetical protein
MTMIIITDVLFKVQAHQLSATRAEWYTGRVLDFWSGGALFESRRDTDHPD